MTLLLRFAPDLVMAVQDPPAALEHLLRRYYRPQVEGCGPTPEDAIVVSSSAAPVEPGTGELLACEQEIELRRSDGITLLTAPGVVGWCDPLLGRAGVHLADPESAVLARFVAMAFTSLVFELAATRGWLGLHAAAVAPGGRGVLLPGPSGCGKTTLFRGMHAAGFPVLSDDLLWVRESDAGFVARALERGVPSEPVPSPTVAEAPLAAIVCPTIVPDPPSRLDPITPREAAQAVLAEGAFLGGGPEVGVRFRVLVRLAGALPAYRLVAGPDRLEVPPLLAALVR